MSFNFGHKVAYDKPHDSYNPNIESTNKALDEIHQLIPSPTMKDIFSTIERNQFQFRALNTTRNEYTLIFTSAPPACPTVWRNETLKDPAIVYNRDTSDFVEFMKKPFDESTAKEINKLATQFVNPCIEDLMAIGFPLCKNLKSCLEEVNATFEEDRRHPLMIKYKISSTNYSHVLQDLMKKRPILSYKSSYVHFFGHPFWQECLLLPVQKEGTQLKDLTLFLWGTRQYPKWQSQVSTKIWMLKQIVPLNPDLYFLIASQLLTFSLGQPIKELTTSETTVPEPKRKAEEQLNSEPLPKRLKIESNES